MIFLLKPQIAGNVIDRQAIQFRKEALGILTKSSHALHNRFIIGWIIDIANPEYGVGESDRTETGTHHDDRERIAVHAEDNENENIRQ